MSGSKEERTRTRPASLRIAAAILGALGTLLVVSDLESLPVLPPIDLRGLLSNDEPTRPRTTCVDVTSHDQNWDNDMRCTRPDGSTFSTSYEGARRFE